MSAVELAVAPTPSAGEEVLSDEIIFSLVRGPKKPVAGKFAVA
jgi:hypothetical protein